MTCCWNPSSRPFEEDPLVGGADDCGFAEEPVCLDGEVAVEAASLTPTTFGCRRVG